MAVAYDGPPPFVPWEQRSRAMELGRFDWKKTYKHPTIVMFSNEVLLTKKVCLFVSSRFFFVKLSLDVHFF